MERQKKQEQNTSLVIFETFIVTETIAVRKMSFFAHSPQNLTAKKIDNFSNCRALVSTIRLESVSEKTEYSPGLPLDPDEWRMFSDTVFETNSNSHFNPRKKMWVRENIMGKNL